MDLHKIEVELIGLTQLISNPTTLLQLAVMLDLNVFLFSAPFCLIFLFLNTDKNHRPFYDKIHNMPHVQEKTAQHYSISLTALTV